MTLTVDGTVVVRIKAKEKWNATSVQLIIGGKYDFSADGQWHDARIPSGPAGYLSSNGVLRLAESFRRMPRAPWFALIGATVRDDSKAFVIGKEKKTHIESYGGTLLCFANDIPFMYWNNSGEVELTIKRVA